MQKRFNLIREIDTPAVAEEVMLNQIETRHIDM